VRQLEQLLVQVPVVYAELEHALLPGRSAEPPDTSPDPRHRPAPARLEVTEHRHLLLKGLRWWVDAVVDLDDRRFHVGLGDSPARMCALLLANLAHMADEDQDTLRGNLWEWVGDAMPMVGKVVAPSAPMLPREALERVVPVHVAAKALGVSVSTVKRRTVGKRDAGQVLLRDAAGQVLCVQSDLPPAWCAHCRGAQRVRTVTA
jgi:hypothetical protein